jgi:hypothetical protein
MNGLRRVLLIAVAAVFFMSFAVSAAAEDDTSDSSATVELTAAASEEVAEEIAEMTNTEAIVEMTTESTLEGQFAFSSEDGLAWARAQLGKYIDVDGAYGAQCVDLIYAYYEYLGVGRRGGNGRGGIVRADRNNRDRLAFELPTELLGQIAVYFAGANGRSRQIGKPELREKLSGHLSGVRVEKA